MEIAANTKISALIRANPEAVEAIASISKHFEKLRNPLLRKLLASRVTIAEAARIGGCQVNVFYEKLQPLGFTVSQRTQEPAPVAAAASMPAFLAHLPAAAVRVLDVREDIETGNDPFLKITDAAEALDSSSALMLINTFEPSPLISILGRRGYAVFTEEKAPDLVHTYFWLKDAVPITPEPLPAAGQDFDAIITRYGEKVKRVDVRHLEMPQPMVTILCELEELPQGWALHVSHRRVPQYLLPQLQERGDTYAIKEAAPEEVYLLIYKV